CIDLGLGDGDVVSRQAVVETGEQFPFFNFIAYLPPRVLRLCASACFDPLAGHRQDSIALTGHFDRVASGLLRRGRLRRFLNNRRGRPWSGWLRGLRRTRRSLVCERSVNKTAGAPTR